MAELKDPVGEDEGVRQSCSVDGQVLRLADANKTHEVGAVTATRVVTGVAVAGAFSRKIIRSIAEVQAARRLQLLDKSGRYVTHTRGLTCTAYVAPRTRRYAALSRPPRARAFTRTGV